MNVVRWACAARLVVALFLSACLWLPANAQRYVHVATWGDRGKDNTTITRPGSLLALQDGHILVNESSSNPIVTKLASDGTFVKTIGTQGTGPGQFTWPTGMAQLADGTLVIGDYWTERIQLFTPDGTYLSQFDGNDGAHPRFGRPHGICVDSDDNIYVAGENAGVWVYRPDGTYVRHWSTTHLATVIEGLAIGPDNLLYVGFSYATGVAVFRKDGTFVRSFDGTLNGDAPFYGTIGLKFDRYGNLYVTEALRQQVRVVTTKGAVVAKIGTQGTGDGQFNRPIEALPLPDGRVLVTEEQNGNIQVFQMLRPQYRYRQKFFVPGGDPPFIGPHGLTVEATGTVLTAGFDGKVRRFQPDGTALGIVHQTSGWLHGVDTLSDGTLVVSERFSYQLAWVRPDGTLIGRQPSGGESNGVWVDPFDNAYVTNWSGEIRIFSPDRVLQRIVTSPAGWNWVGPHDIVSDLNGGWIVSDHYGQQALVKLNSDFTLAKGFGQIEGGWLPNGLLRTRTGLLVAAAQQLKEIHVFDENDNRIARFGNDTGGQFGDIVTDVAEGIDGSLLAASNDGYVHVWEPVYDPLAPTSTFSQSPVVPSSGWNNGPVSVTLHATDNPLGFGVREIRYSVDMGAEQVVSGDSATFTVNGDGVHTIAFRAVDHAGNVETAQFATVKIDQTAPATTAAVVASTFTLSASDSLSGVDGLSYRIDSGAWSAYTGPVALPIGARVIRYKALDKAGNFTPERTQLVSQFLKSVTITPSPAYAGSTVTLQVDLVANAPDGGIVVDLVSSIPGVLGVPASITVPAGQAKATASLVLGPVSDDTVVRVDASHGDMLLSRNTTVLPPSPTTLIAAPSVVAGGAGTVLTVTLVSKAPAGGQVVSLQSLDPSVLAVPATVNVPAGQTSASVPATTSPVVQDRSVLVAATVNGESAVCAVAVRHLTAASLSFSPSGVVGGSGSALRVVLNRPAPAGGFAVPISTAGAGGSVPDSIVVPAGATTASVAVTTTAVSMESALVSRTLLPGSRARGTLTVRPAQLSTITVAPTVVKGGSGVTGTVTLSGPAPAGGIVVRLATNQPGVVGLPATVTVPAGATKATFSVTTSVVPSNTAVVLGAFQNLVAKSATLSVTK